MATYPFATVLRPKPYRSLRQRSQQEGMLAAGLFLAIVALAMLWLF